MKRLFVAVAITGAFISCNNASTNKTVETKDTTTVVTDHTVTTPADSGVTDMHHAENAIDYIGTYAGTVPCASCEGIEMNLDLKADKTFTLKETYKGGKEEGKFDSKGTYNVTGNIVALKFDGKDADRNVKFHVGEGQLFMLDADGKKVEGTLANNYILQKK